MNRIEKIKRIVKIFALPFLLGLLTFFLHFYVEQTLLSWVVAKIVLVITLTAHLLAFPALLFSLRESVPVIESYKKATKIASSFLGVLILYYIFIAGGSFFLIIPGIIFLVWFVFSPYVAIFEEKRGFSALWRSRELVQGKGWKIFFISAPFIIFSVLFGIFFGPLLIGNFLVFLLGLYLAGLFYWLILWLVFFRVYGEREKMEVSSWKPKVYQKIFFGVVVALGSIVFIGYAIFGFNMLFRDYDPPFDDSHLILPEVEMIKEGNLYIFFEEGGCGFLEITDPLLFISEEQYDTYYKFIVDNPEWAREIIEENKAVYRCLDRMAEHTHYTSPGDLGLWPEIIINPGELLKIFRAGSFKSAYLFYQGNDKEALDLIINMAKVGTLMTEAPRPVFVETMVGVAVHATAFNGYPYSEKVNISLEDAVLYAEKLAELELTEEAFARAIQMEYTYMAYSVDHTAELMEKWGESGAASFLKQPSFFWKPEQTKRKFAEHYGPAIELKPEEFMEDFHLEMMRPIELLPLSILVWDNMAGRVIISSTIMILNPWIRMQEIKDTIFLNRAIKVALVLQAYEQETGELPANLTELVPEYLSGVPEDPFYKGVEMGYSPEERKLYSLKKDDVSEYERNQYIIEF